jgi:hypothetical protein
MTVQPDRKDMPHEFGTKQLKLKRGNIRVRTMVGLTALVWKDRWEVYMQTNIDPTKAEGNFFDDNNHPMKPHIIERYNWHMSYVDISDHMANSYSTSRHTLQVHHEIVFPPYSRPISCCILMFSYLC